MNAPTASPRKAQARGLKELTKEARAAWIRANPDKTPRPLRAKTRKGGAS